MSTQAIDYAALAKQAGAVASEPTKAAPAATDYGALAKQAGAVESRPAEAPKPLLDWSKVVNNLPHSTLQFIESTAPGPTSQVPDVNPSGRFSKAHPDFADKHPMLSSAADSVEELAHNMSHLGESFEKDPVGTVQTVGTLARGLLGSVFEHGGGLPPRETPAANSVPVPPAPIPAGVKDVIGLVSPRARYITNLIDRLRGAGAPGAAAKAAEAAVPELYDQISAAMGQGKYASLSATAQKSIRDMAARLDVPPSPDWAPKPNPNVAPVEWQTPAEKAAAAQPAPQAQPAPSPASVVSPQPEAAAAAPTPKPPEEGYTQWLNRTSPLPEPPRIPQEGNVPYIRTDDGSIYAGTSADYSHVKLAERLGIPPGRIRDGGFINNGSIDDYGASSANINKWAEQKRAESRLEYEKTTAPKSNVVTIPFSGEDLPKEAWEGSARARKAPALAYYLTHVEGMLPEEAMKLAAPEQSAMMKNTANAARAGAESVGAKVDIPDAWFDGKVSKADWQQAMVEMRKLHGRAVVQAAQQRLGKLPPQARGPAQALSDALNIGPTQ